MRDDGLSGDVNELIMNAYLVTVSSVLVSFLIPSHEMTASSLVDRTL